MLRRLVGPIFAGLVLVAGCGEPRSNMNDRVPGCTSCHGTYGRANGGMVGGVYDPNQAAAPPLGSNAVVTGVHAAHVNPTDAGVYRPIACTECHPNNTAGTHPNGGPTEVTFVNATAADLSGFSPTRVQGDGTTTATTCTTYCHNGAGGGSVGTWSWTGAAADCGSCHGNPPLFLSDGTTPHTASTACGGCHAGYTNTSVARADHIDGTIQATGCSGCHGTSGRPNGGMVGGVYDPNQEAAPPLDSSGNATGVLVGVHAAHVNPTDAGVYRPIACTECHPNNTTGGHPGGGLTVTFAAAIGADLAGFVPTFLQGNGTTTDTTCSTYCHGAKFTGGGGSVLSWGWDDPTDATCDSCHGNPPTFQTNGTTPHSSSTVCATCHPGYTNATVTRATHIDGVVDVSASCTTCHGNPVRIDGDMAGVTYDPNQEAAPPADTGGNLTGVLVGVHLAHVNPTSAGGVYPPLACVECHPDNTTGSHPGGGLTVVFPVGSGARLAGYAATFVQGDGTATATTCNAYCHSGAAGGSVGAWSWTGAAADCASCHGFPPTVLSDTVTPHSPSPACGSCHSGYTGIAVNLANHIDGVVQSATTCTSCHGTAGRANGGMVGATYDPNQPSAPPVDSNLAATGVLVGAHVAHVNPTNAGVYKPIACTECHPNNTAGTHPNGGPTDVTFAAATGADLDLFSPTRVLGNGTSTPTTCSVYCHSGAGAGSVVGSWSWTGAAATCGSCHGNPPALQSNGVTPHTASTACETCHTGYTNASVTRATHIDGIVQVSASCTTCHGQAGRANGSMAFGTFDPNQAAAPPVDSGGNLTGVLVGVHLSHVNPDSTGVYGPIACTECHPDNTTGPHPDSTRTVTFVNATAADLSGFSPTRVQGDGTVTATTCTTYCHNGPGGGSVATWSWTGAAADCGSCHGYPPASHAPADTACGDCHPGYTATTVHLPSHINGQLDGGESPGGLACGACHGAIFSAMNGTTPKPFKHTLGVVAGTNDSATDSGISWGNPLQGNLPAARSCVNMCHGDHPHDLTSPVVATHEYNVYLDSSSASGRGGTSRTGTSRNKTDFAPAAANGGLCVSCHLNPIAPGGATVDRAGYDASAHDRIDSTAGATTYQWRFQLHSGTFERNCTKCHASTAEGTTPSAPAVSSGANSVHFNDNPALLAGATSAASATAFVCYNCHGTAATPANGSQGNRSGKDLEAQFAKAFSHPIESDTVHDTAAERGALYNDGTFSGANRHVNCADCHDPHRAGPTLHTIPGNAIAATSPLRGATGVSFASPATNWALTVDANFGNPATAAFEYEICFKCHSSFAFGTTPPTGQSTFAETDVAQEFSTSNQSYHPVVGALPAADPGANGSSQLVAAQLVGTDHTWSPGQTMTCTDCHNADAGSPQAQGPHGSAVRFLLAGTQRAWPYTVAGVATGTVRQLSASETGLGTANGLFCRNCHPALNSAGTNALHRHADLRGGEHGTNAIASCTGCHIRIPHGGKVSRLIVTTNAPARYRVGTPAWSQFTKRAKDAYTPTNTFTGRTGCTEHGNTAGESW